MAFSSRCALSLHPLCTALSSSPSAGSSVDAGYMGKGQPVRCFQCRVAGQLPAAAAPPSLSLGAKFPNEYHFEGPSARSLERFPTAQSRQITALRQIFFFWAEL